MSPRFIILRAIMNAIFASHRVVYCRFFFVSLFIIYLLFVYATSHVAVEFEYGSNRTKTKVIIEIMQRERNGFFRW